MILLIFGIGLILLIAGIICTVKIYEEWIYLSLNLVGGFICAISLIAMLILGILVSEDKIIDQKIALYEEENIKIESQVAALVENYKEYEQETFNKIAIDGDPTFAVTLFPELKSNELVNSQIKLYCNNNAAIKELKEEKLTLNLYRWWLYFG